MDTLRDEVALLREELRLKDGRMGRLLPSRRPHYKPLDRIVILELRARRGWTVEQMANRFLVEAKTVASWMRRLDEPTDRPLVQAQPPSTGIPWTSAASDFAAEPPFARPPARVLRGTLIA